jgi:hypothetical protein
MAKDVQNSVPQSGKHTKPQSKHGFHPFAIPTALWPAALLAALRQFGILPVSPPVLLSSFSDCLLVCFLVSFVSLLTLLFLILPLFVGVCFHDLPFVAYHRLLIRLPPPRSETRVHFQGSLKCSTVSLRQIASTAMLARL